jgi:predicted AAA+ superfamily ATPase
MDQLEALYETIPKAVGFVERKIDIPSHTVNLYGPPLSGKTWAVLDYANAIPKKRRLYIDFSDLRLDKSALADSLQGFIQARNIETLILDSYDGSIPIPHCRQAVVVTQAPFTENPFMPLLELTPLDFEEYLAFEKRLAPPEHSFSLYLKTGSLPLMTGVHESLLTRRLHELVRSIFPERVDQALLRHMARHLGKPVTPHQLYSALKRSHKISKDRLYAALKAYEARRMIAWVEKFGQPRAAKRLLFYDFAMPASLFFEKSLMGQLYTIAAWRFIRSGREVFYHDALDLYDPAEDLGIILSPFANPESSAAKIAGRIEAIEALGIKRLTVLTISNTFRFHFDKISVQAVPFYEWMIEDALQ